MNDKYYRDVRGASYGVPVHERIQQDSKVHLYLPTESRGSVHIGWARLRGSASDQTQL